MAEGNNSELESQEEQPKLDKEQYDRLKKGGEEWNKWRKENPEKEIWLQEADLRKAHLEEVILDNAHLEGAILQHAHLERAIFWDSHLEGAKLIGVHLEGAHFDDAHLEGAKLRYAHLEKTELEGAHLEGAELQHAYIEGAKLKRAHLQGVNLFEAKLQGADLVDAKLQGARFMGVIVNGSTDFLYCKIDEDTDFRHTGLENVRIESGTKTLLKYNIRRMNWRDWYVKHRFWQRPVKLFWSLSNYGISTLRIALSFFILALLFALVYYFVPSLIKDLHGTGNWYSDLVRACYFSVVTMTTLGFGDMFANKQSMTGHILLMFQVILGYVLLGALVTRLAVLFTSDGPAGSFTPMDKETKELLAKLEKDKGN